MHIFLIVTQAEPLEDASWEAAQLTELVALSEQTNTSALLERAKELNGGKECRFDEADCLDRGRMGGMHIYRRIVFSDGTVWLARILRENYTSFSDSLSNQIFLSECATLHWLDSVSNVPTPRLHDYGLRRDSLNVVGVAYMRIDEMPGRPYNPAIATEAQKRKVLSQWAHVVHELSSRPFDQIRSLEMGADNQDIHIGPISSDRTGTLPPIGPFRTAYDYYTSWTQIYLDLKKDRQIFSEFTLDAYLMFRYLKDTLNREKSWLAKRKGLDSGPFYLKHVNDKGVHILIDGDYNITGIID